MVGSAQEANATVCFSKTKLWCKDSVLNPIITELSYTNGLPNIFKHKYLVCQLLRFPQPQIGQSAPTKRWRHFVS